MEKTPFLAAEQGSAGRAPGTAARRTRIWNYAFLLVCSALLIALHATHQLDSDEGLVLHGAWNILNGRTLYTDFFEYVAPGSFYLVAAAWKMFGAHYWVAKFIGIAAIASAVLGVYRIGEILVAEQRVTVAPWAMLFGPFVFCLFSGYWPAVNHNTFNLALVIWSTYFVSRSLLKGDWVDAAIAGGICGIAVLFLQHRGAALAATAIPALYFFQRGGKPRARWASTAAFLIALAVPIAGVLLVWSPSVLVENLIRFPATHYMEVNWVDPSLFFIGATYIVLAAWLLRHGSGRAAWFMMLLQAVFFMSALQRPDLGYITRTLFPLLALFPLLVSAASTASRLSKFFLAWIGAGVLLLTVLVPTAIATRYATPLFEVSQHPALRYVRENCTASPYLYAGPFVPGHYFETGKLNPTRHSYLVTNLNTSAQFLDVLKDIQAHAPQCVVTNYPLVEKFRHDRNNPVDNYIARNYEVVYQAGRIQVWMALSSR